MAEMKQIELSDGELTILVFLLGQFLATLRIASAEDTRAYYEVDALNDKLTEAAGR